MRRFYNSVIGTLLIIAAIFGLAFSVGGIVGLGAMGLRVESAAKHQLVLLDQALSATDTGLRNATASLERSRATLTSIGGTVEGSTTAIDDIVPAIEAMGGVVGTQLPSTLQEATGALTVFANTAAVIDRVMLLLVSLPFVSLPAYDPEVPLADSVLEVRDSVDDLGENLQDIQSGLDKTAANLREIRRDVSGIGTALDGLGESLDGTAEVLSSYQEIVANLRTQVDAALEGIEEALRWARIVAIVVLTWLGIASLGLFTQGLEMLRSNRQLEAAPTQL